MNDWYSTNEFIPIPIDYYSQEYEPVVTQEEWEQNEHYTPINLKDFLQREKEYEANI